jgi:CRP-like cAMP-binding protein
MNVHTSTGVSINPLLRRLRQCVELTDADSEALRHVFTGQIQQIGTHQEIIGEGDRPSQVQLVLSGFACRHKILEDGRRQIIACLLPGDFCDVHVTILGRMDHAIATITPCTVAQIPGDQLQALIENNPRVAKAIWWATLVDYAIQREWLVNVGQRPAVNRVAHLFCEFLLRLRAAGITHDNSYEMPLTQQELGQALGLSTVHVNRVLKELRDSGLIRLKGRQLDIDDPAGLAALASFNPNYLHLPDDFAIA